MIALGAKIRARLRAAHVVLGCSLIVWVMVAATGSSFYRAHLDGLTDHSSHYMSTVLFAYRGWDIYRLPTKKTCEISGTPELGRYSAGISTDPNWVLVCTIQERQGKRPLLINWYEYARPYPPGLFLFMAPEALLHEFTSLSVETLNRLALIKFLVFAHLGTLLIWNLFRRPTGEDVGWRRLGAIIVPMSYFELVWWSANGMYDGVFICLTLYAIQKLQQKRPTGALLALSGAIFCHFRALWFLPLLPVLAVQIFKAWPVERRLRRRHFALLAISTVLLGAAASAAWTVYPSLAKLPLNNGARWPSVPHGAELWLTNFALPAGVVLAWLIWQRAWKLLAVTGWQVVVLSFTRQAQEWHVLAALPLFGIAAWQGARARDALAALFAYVVFSVATWAKMPAPGPLFAHLFALNPRAHDSLDIDPSLFNHMQAPPRDDSELAFAKRGHAPNHILTGPHIRLKPGAYGVKFRLEWSDHAVGAPLICKVDVAARDPITEAWVRPRGGEADDATPELEFTVERNAPRSRWEFRVWCNGMADVSVREVTLSKL